LTDVASISAAEIEDPAARLETEAIEVDRQHGALARSAMASR
jgi:hypothetical protein